MISISGKDYPITLQNILIAANEHKATDIHININDTPRVRADGKLLRITDEKISAKQCQALLDEIFGHDTSKKSELHKEKRIAYSFSRHLIGRYRANISAQRGSFGISIRTLAQEPMKYEELGLPDMPTEFVKNTKGLYVVTGASSTGKSTTLASIIDKINTEENLHIMAIENPIEYLHRHKSSIVTQKEIGTDTPSKAEALKWSANEDVDVYAVSSLEENIIQQILNIAENKPVYAIMGEKNYANMVKTLVENVRKNESEKIENARKRVANALGGAILQERRLNKISFTVYLNNTQETKEFIQTGKYEEGGCED